MAGLANANVPDGVDPHLVDLLSRVFAAVLSDDQISAELRTVMARLQTSVLRLCLVDRTLLDNTLSGSANILICPNLDAANILFNVLKMVSGHGVTVGPILLGAAGSAHVLTPSATVRRVVNMTALAAAHSSLRA